MKVAWGGKRLLQLTALERSVHCGGRSTKAAGGTDAAVRGHEYWYSALSFILSGVPVYGVLPSTLRMGLNLSGNVLKHIGVSPR